MVKIRVFSDLHIEFNARLRYKDCGEDVIVLAGDIHRFDKVVDYVYRRFPEDKEIVLIAGNHEFYGTTLENGYSVIKNRAKKFSNIHFLEKNEFIFKDIIFLGTTLWSDFNLFGDFHSIKHIIKSKINDFSMIKIKNGSRLSPDDLRDEFFKSLDFKGMSFLNLLILLTTN